MGYRIPRDYLRAFAAKPTGDEDDMVPAGRGLWLALLGGDKVWIDPDARPVLTDRYAAGVLTIVLTFHTILLWTVLPDRLATAERPALVWLAVIAGTLASAALWVRGQRVTVGRPTKPSRLVPRAAWRAVAFSALVLSVIVVSESWYVLAAWTLAVMGGCDAYLTIRALGIAPAPTQWWRRFVASPVHFGIIGAAIAAFVLGSTASTRWEVVWLYLSVHVGIFLGGMTVVFLDGLRQFGEGERMVERRRVVERERQHRIHWLHDDVLSEIRITALRLRAGDSSPKRAAMELDELDHRLRLRQLDEIYLGGPVRLAEVLQPHLRRMQSLGIDLVSVPSLDVVGRRVDEPLGRAFGRAVAVFTSNAANAGATKLAVEVTVSDDVVVLAVTDDAGGFDLDAVPPGRGLHRLMDDLGRGRVHRKEASGGSTLIAVLPIDPDHAPPERPWAREGGTTTSDVTPPSAPHDAADRIDTLDAAVRGAHDRRVQPADTTDQEVTWHTS